MAEGSVYTGPLVDAGNIEVDSGLLGLSPDLIIIHMLIEPPLLTRSQNPLKADSPEPRHSWTRRDRGKDLQMTRPQTVPLNIPIMNRQTLLMDFIP